VQGLLGHVYLRFWASTFAPLANSLSPNISMENK
jgi:hypothetical protein